MSTTASTCYRFPVAPERSQARLYVERRVIDARLKDFSADVFGIEVDAGVLLPAKADLALQTADGWYQVRVNAVQQHGTVQYLDLQRLGELNSRSISSKIGNRQSSESALKRFGRAMRIESAAICGLLCVSMIAIGIYLGLGESRIKSLASNGKRLVKNYFRPSGSTSPAATKTTQTTNSTRVHTTRTQSGQSYVSVGSQKETDQRVVQRLIGQTDMTWSEVAANLGLSDDQSRTIYSRLSHEFNSENSGTARADRSESGSPTADTEIAATTMMQDVESVLSDEQLERLASLRSGHAERF